MSVENVPSFFGVLKNLGRLPSNHTDLVCAIDQLVIIDAILEIFVSFDCRGNRYRFIEQLKAAVNDLVPEVINYSIPK
jgi:hypothetical protein